MATMAAVQLEPGFSRRVFCGRRRGKVQTCSLTQKRQQYSQNRRLRPTPARASAAAGDGRQSSSSEHDPLFLDLQYHFAKQQLDDAIAREDYTEASRLQSTVDSLELTYRHSKLVQDRQAHEGILFPLGSCIVHRRFGYRGIVVGYDHLCNAPEEWCKAMRVDILPRGRQQPFYHVLVDVRDRPGGQTTYVAEENVALARRSHLLDHPLVEKYFQMRRAADGGWVYYPSQELRSLYYKDGGF